MEGALLRSARYRHSPRVQCARKHGGINKTGQAGRLWREIWGR